MSRFNVGDIIESSKTNYKYEIISVNEHYYELKQIPNGKIMYKSVYNLRFCTVIQSGNKSIFTKPESIKQVDKGFIGSYNLPIDLDYDEITDTLHFNRGA